MITPANWERIRALFQSALERPADERARFVREQTDGDEAIRREVDSLLAAHVEAEGLLVAAGRGPSFSDDDAFRAVTPRLAPGSRLGAFEILGLLGAGGMGEVYKARDTRLDRKVAVKVLAPELAGDAAFRARFEREAKAISALNHAHICRLYDIGREDHIEYLVLELVEGETLAARLRRGRLPLSQVLGLGVQIADALEAAHRQGIIHRDLKPGNVMLTAAGSKLLDFGLAKSTMISAAGGVLSPPERAAEAASAGMIIGTLPYMAPEQLQGQPADVRSDIFALGAILHEMATGRRAFEATTQASLIGKILETEPPTVSSLAPLAPPALDHVVQSCLAKSPDDRWQTAHDVKMQLQWLQGQGSHVEVAAAPAGVSRRLLWVPWALAAASLALLATVLFVSSRPVVTRAPQTRLDLILPPHIRLNEYDFGAISPDGRHFVFSAMVNGALRQLVLRDMASTELVVIPGTDNPYRPFWSPDSKSIAFVVAHSGQLRKVHVGGPARVLAETGSMTSGTWAPGVILFGPKGLDPSDGRIQRVAETGGTASAVDTLSLKPGQGNPVVPAFLPDGLHFMFNIAGESALHIASIAEPGTRRILDDAFSAAYGAGHLFYSRGKGLFAVPFDAERLEVSGAEVQVTAQAATFSVSRHGTIVYRPELVSASRLTWFDRSGRRTSTLGEPGPYEAVVLSPSDRHATVVRIDEQLSGDLWNVDLSSGIFSRLTVDSADDSDPSWSPDERALAFTSTRTGRVTVFVKDLVTGKEDQLVPFEEGAALDQWTPDGKFVIFRTHGKAVYAMPLSGDRKPRMLVDTPYVEDQVYVSPDGRWVAFNSDESGVWEVYVAAFPAFTSKRPISDGGGVQPQWRADGRELFYLAPDGSMMSVRVDARPELTLSPASRLFPTNIQSDWGRPRYGVTADGQRFLALEPVEGAASFTFLLNWPNARPAPGPRQ